MSKEAKKIFLVLVFYSLAGGIFYNFQELWMAENLLSVRTIGTILSLSALITVSTIFLCSNLIKKERLKTFCIMLLIVKAVIIFIMFFLHKSGWSILIKMLVMLDYAINTEIYACIYPLLATVSKSDRTYAKKDLVYSAFYNIGVLITGFFLGKTVGYVVVNYNFYCLLAGALIIMAVIVLFNVKITYNNCKNVEEKDYNTLYKLINIISKDKISKIYILFLLCGQISYNCVLSLIITILTTGLNFSPQKAASLVVLMGVIAVVLGIIVLTKLTFKNNYISLSIKYIIRALLYILAVIFNNKIMFLIALMYPKIIAESYSHITDAPYINRFANDYQLAFCNLREMIVYFGKSLGTLICGISLSVGIRLNFLFAAIFGVFQAVFSMYALYLRNKEVK